MPSAMHRCQYRYMLCMCTVVLSTDTGPYVTGTGLSSLSILSSDSLSPLNALSTAVRVRRTLKVALHEVKGRQTAHPVNPHPVSGDTSHAHDAVLRP